MSLKTDVKSFKIISSNIVKNIKVLSDLNQCHLCPNYVKSPGPDIALSKSQIGIEPEPADFGGIEGKDFEFLFMNTRSAKCEIWHEF